MSNFSILGKTKSLICLMADHKTYYWSYVDGCMTVAAYDSSIVNQNLLATNKQLYLF